jgi:chorismate mutase
VARLAAERAALEGQVAALRRAKDTMPPADYERELERLLVALARAGQAARAAERGAAP